MGKRGISAIVATVLTILITIAGVTIMWVAVVPVIKDNIAFEGIDARLSIETAGGYTLYDSDDNIACVQIKRGSDESEISGAEIIFNIDGDSQKVIVEAPGPNQRRTYCFDFIGYSAPQEVGVAPVISIRGNNRTGDITSKVEIAESLLVEVPAREELIDVGERNFMRGLVSHWKFEGDASDSAGENDGTLEGVAEIVTGAGREGMVLNLTNDVADCWTGNNYVGLGNPLSLSDKSYTISAWINTVIQGINDNTIFSEHESTSPGKTFMFHLKNDKLSLNFYGGETEGTISILNNVWTFVAVTFDYDVKTITYYVNGQQDSSFESVTLWYDAPSSGIQSIGARYDKCADSNGAIDDVMIFDKALSEEEVSGIYNFQK